MAGVITAAEPSWIGPFTGLSPRQFGKLISALRREGADPVRKGRPWSLPLEDRVLLVAAYWRTNLTLRQLAPLFGVSKSAADRIVDHLGPALALQPRRRFRKDTVLIVDGTLVPTRDRTVAASSKNYRYSTNHQVVIDADTRLVVAVGKPLPGNRNDCRAWEDSGAKAAIGATPTVIADGGYRGTGLTIPHYRRHKDEELPSWKEDHKELEDPARLPPQRRRRLPRHARHRPPAQPHHHRMTGKRAGHPACPGAFTGHRLGRSRGGLTSKIHLACDAVGRPLAFTVTGGNTNDCTQFTAVMEAIRVPRPGPGRPRTRPDRVVADKGYSSKAIRTWLRRRGIAHAIPERTDQVRNRLRRGNRGGRPPAFDRNVYKRRNVVERCFNRLKQWRGIATRYDKTAESYQAAVTLAALLM